MPPVPRNHRAKFLGMKVARSFRDFRRSNRPVSDRAGRYRYTCCIRVTTAR